MSSSTSTSTPQTTTTTTTEMPHPTTTTQPPRLVVTTHDPLTGKPTFVFDQRVPLFHPMGPEGSSFAVFDTRTSVPIDNSPIIRTSSSSSRVEPSPSSPKTGGIPRCPAPSGASFSLTNLAPGVKVPFHRTLSLDYAVVLSGEVVLKLKRDDDDYDDDDEGKKRGRGREEEEGLLLLEEKEEEEEERTVKAGEFIVQGGVNHSWENRTGEVCRMLFVMLGADKVKLGNGRELEGIEVKR